MADAQTHRESVQKSGKIIILVKGGMVQEVYAKGAHYVEVWDFDEVGSTLAPSESYDDTVKRISRKGYDVTWP